MVARTIHTIHLVSVSNISLTYEKHGIKLSAYKISSYCSSKIKFCRKFNYIFCFIGYGLLKFRKVTLLIATGQQTYNLFIITRYMCLSRITRYRLWRRSIKDKTPYALVSSDTTLPFVQIPQPFCYLSVLSLFLNILQKLLC